MADYQDHPVFFEADWLLQKYHGWQCRLQRPTYRVLEKSYGVMKRVLVLCRSRIVPSATDLFGPASEVIIHDFSGDTAPERTIFGRLFRLASDSERIINKATLVLDLSESLDALHLRMRPGFRQSITKAMARGVVAKATTTPTPSLLSAFVSAYNTMAKSRGLRVVCQKELEAMFRQSNLVMCVASLEDVPLSYALAYVTSRTAYYMLGVSVGRMDDGAGKLAQRELITECRHRGLKWYDFGGVPEINEQNGIYLFKKGFGGELLLLGSEFVYRPAIVRGVRAGIKALRTFDGRTAA